MLAMKKIITTEDIEGKIYTDNYQVGNYVGTDTARGQLDSYALPRGAWERENQKLTIT